MGARAFAPEWLWCGLEDHRVTQVGCGCSPASHSEQEQPICHLPLPFPCSAPAQLTLGTVLQQLQPVLAVVHWAGGCCFLSWVVRSSAGLLGTSHEGKWSPSAPASSALLQEWPETALPFSTANNGDCCFIKYCTISYPCWFSLNIDMYSHTACCRTL